MTVLSFIQPLVLDAPTSVEVALVLHIIAAIVAVPALIGLSARSIAISQVALKISSFRATAQR